MEELLLGRAQLIVGIELLLVSSVTFEDHEFFVVKDEVWAFVEGGKDGERFGEFECVAAGLGVTFSRGFAEFDKTENFFWKSIANSGDGSGRSTVDKAVVDLRVNPSHENERFVLACDILGGVAKGIGSTEFLETDEGGKFFTKREEEVGLSLEPIIRRVVNHRRKVTACLENFAEVMNLGSGRGSAAEDTRDDHEAIGSDFASVDGVGGSDSCVLRTRADDSRDSSFDESLNSFHALLVGEEWPVTH